MRIRKMRSGFHVMAKPCNQCLFGRNRIVDAARKREIIEICRERGTNFICHKTQIARRDVCCHAFFKKFPNSTIGMIISSMFGLNKFIYENQLGLSKR